MVDIILKQPVRLTIGGGLNPEDPNKRLEAKVYQLQAGLNRNVPPEVASHDYIKLHLAGPRPQAENTFNEGQLALLEQLGLTPAQRAVLDQIQLTDEQRAVLKQPPPKVPGGDISKMGAETEDPKKTGNAAERSSGSHDAGEEDNSENGKKSGKK